MFYRRKILLSLLELFDSKLSKIELQKYLFLSTTGSDKPAYEFIPYKFGCYSFTAASDLNVLNNKDFIRIDEHYISKTCKESFLNELNQNDRNRLKAVKLKSKDFSTNRDLMRYLYLYAPYYALNSTVKNNYLSEKETAFINESKIQIQEPALTTIGYEGLSIEAYFNRLIRNNIRCLVDVRKNPRSMKFGFTRSRLESLCTETGIKYISIPELGIETDDRKNLSDENSYKLLFESYLNKTVKNTSSEQLSVVDLISKYKRIALTCFEADINKCHRKVLADYIQTKYKPVESIIHL